MLVIFLPYQLASRILSFKGMSREIQGIVDVGRNDGDINEVARWHQFFHVFRLTALPLKKLINENMK